MKKLILLLLLIPLTITAAPTQPKDEFCWTAPTENIDGSPLTDLAGFALYCGAVSGSYTFSYNITDPSLTCDTFANAGMPDGSQFCAMTAYDPRGIDFGEGPYSNEINFTLSGGVVPATSVPAAPFSFGIQ